MELASHSKAYSSASPPLATQHSSSYDGGSSVGNGGVGCIEHTVTKFDTLAGVAIKYGVEVADIRKMNGLTTDLQVLNNLMQSHFFPPIQPPIVFVLSMLGLFNMLSDSSLEIRQQADSALSEFLQEIKNSPISLLPSVDYGRIEIECAKLLESPRPSASYPQSYRNKVATTKFIPWPIEIRFCEPNNSTNYDKRPASLRYWFRAKGKLSYDEALHRCVAAYTSDLIFLNVSLNPHRAKGLKTTSVSLDHSVLFHRPIRADEWLLFVISSPNAYNGRGFVSGQMFNRKGEAVLCQVEKSKEDMLKEDNLRDKLYF